MWLRNLCIPLKAPGRRLRCLHAPFDEKTAKDSSVDCFGDHASLRKLQPCGVVVPNLTGKSTTRLYCTRWKLTFFPGSSRSPPPTSTELWISQPSCCRGNCGTVKKLSNRLHGHHEASRLQGLGKSHLARVKLDVEGVYDILGRGYGHTGLPRVTATPLYCQLLPLNPRGPTEGGGCLAQSQQLSNASSVLPLFPYRYQSGECQRGGIKMFVKGPCLEHQTACIGGHCSGQPEPCLRST